MYKFIITSYSQFVKNYLNIHLDSTCKEKVVVIWGTPHEYYEKLDKNNKFSFKQIFTKYELPLDIYDAISPWYIEFNELKNKYPKKDIVVFLCIEENGNSYKQYNIRNIYHLRRLQIYNSEKKFGFQVCVFDKDCNPLDYFNEELNDNDFRVDFLMTIIDL